MRNETERAQWAWAFAQAAAIIFAIYMMVLAVGSLWGCERTPGDCRRTCAQLGMDVTFVPIAGDPHACDCKRWGE